MQENIAVSNWRKNRDAIMFNRILAGDISHVLAGTPFPPVESFLPPNPQRLRPRTVEEVEATLIQWSKD